MDIKMYPSHMSDILKGKRNITEEIALKLENILGISAEFWMRLQVEYNISVLRTKMNHVFFFLLLNPQKLKIFNLTKKKTNNSLRKRK